jgi:hypothetical protein
MEGGGVKILIAYTLTAELCFRHRNICVCDKCILCSTYGPQVATDTAAMLTLCKPGTKRSRNAEMELPLHKLRLYCHCLVSG